MGGNMLDLTGWTEITCDESNPIRRHIIDTAWRDGVVLSSLTDPDGDRGPLKVIYTEWGRGDAPELRDYDWRDGQGCKHYVPEATR